jgi:hypothetical protein
LEWRRISPVSAGRATWLGPRHKEHWAKNHQQYTALFVLLAEREEQNTQGG